MTPTVTLNGQTIQLRDAHHDDYNRPADVRFLCGSCHRNWHLYNLPVHVSDMAAFGRAVAEAVDPNKVHQKAQLNRKRLSGDVSTKETKRDEANGREAEPE